MSSLFRSINSLCRRCCYCQLTVMELKNVMTSCLMIMVGLVIGIFVNYKVMLFQSIHVQVPVMNCVH